MDVYTHGGKECKRISFGIVDLNGKTLNCTMWDSYAQQLSTFVQNFGSDDIVIVIIQLGKVKDWKGEPNIENCFFATRLFINDELRRFTSLRGVLCLVMEVNVPRNWQTHYLAKLFILAVRNFLRNFEEIMLKIYLKLQKKLFVLFLVLPAHEGGVFFCPKCKIREKAIVPRFEVRVRVQDRTGTISLFCLIKRSIGFYAGPHMIFVIDKLRMVMSMVGRMSLINWLEKDSYSRLRFHIIILVQTIQFILS